MIGAARSVPGVAAPAIRELHAPTLVLRTLARDHPHIYPALFDSAASGVLGQHCLLAARPDAVLALDRHGQLHAQGIDAHHGGFLANLQSWWQRERRDPGPSLLPFQGGWVVFLSYELSGEIEPGLRLPRSSLPWQAFALRVRSGIVHELASGRMFAFAEPECEGLLDQICADVEAAVLDRPNGGGRSVPAADPLPVTCTVQGLREEPAELFLTRVHAARARIAAGDIYQANLSRWWCAQLVGEGSPAALYESLRRANPAPFAGLLQWGGLCVLSSSPERLVRTLGGTVHTRPIAGTRPRSGSALRERAETDALIANAKERAEHIMLVDLERNDLGRICERGTVRVEELMTIESYAHVHHIVSRVEGRLRCGVTPVEVIRATFPGGTITGCPKYRCMQLIAELEKEGRGAYTGSMGYLNLNGDLDLNILIRTMTVTGGTVEFRAGAGIVADSDPVRELEETRAKARGMLAALAAAPED